MLYKEYDIEVIENPPGQWTALIRRQDGKLVAIGKKPPGPVTATDPHSTREIALERAKRIIDAGGIVSE